MNIPQAVSLDIPLVVDLDGTLVLTDTLQESFVRLLFCNPLAAFGALLSLFSGRAAFKRRLGRLSPLDAGGLPRRDELVDLLRVEKLRHRKIFLVTAADQTIADGIASSTGLFDGAHGSDGKNNLKGANKLAWLRELSLGDFIYAGDSAADLPLFLGARGVILCDVAPSVATQVEKAGIPIYARLNRERHALRGLLAALRPHHWSKNLLVFLPLLLGHAYSDLANVATSVSAFAILCVLTSATYLINDLADLDADRRHPTKGRRAFAAGHLSPVSGLMTGATMAAGALLAGWLLSAPFALALAAYLIVTLAYSFGLKRVPFLDVSIISALFTLRLVMGTVVLDLRQSPWQLAFSLVFFFSMALAKRYGEVRAVSGTEGGGIAGRGYRGDDWPLVLAFGVASSLASLVVLLLFITSDALVSGAYLRPQWLYAVPAPVFAWQMRIWLFSHRSLLHDDPVVFALKDRVSLVLGGIMLVFLMLAL